MGAGTSANNGQQLAYGPGGLNPLAVARYDRPPIRILSLHSRHLGTTSLDRLRASKLRRRSRLCRMAMASVHHLPLKRFFAVFGAYLLYSARRIGRWYGPALSPVIRQPSLTIDDWTVFAVYQHTRFTVAEFKLAMHYFQIPAVFHTGNRLKVGGEEAFIIACARLTYPNRLSALEAIFHRDYTEISRIAQDFACEFVRINTHCEDLRHLLTEERLRVFNTAIRAQQAQRAQTLNIVVDAVFAAREGMTALYVDGVAEFVARPSVCSALLRHTEEELRVSRLQQEPEVRPPGSCHILAHGNHPLQLSHMSARVFRHALFRSASALACANDRHRSALIFRNLVCSFSHGHVQ